MKRLILRPDVIEALVRPRNYVQPGWYAEWLLMIYGRELIVMTHVWGGGRQ